MSAFQEQALPADQSVAPLARADAVVVDLSILAPAGLRPTPESILRALTRSVSDRLLLLDLDLRICFASRGMLDVPRAALPGRSIHDLLPGAERGRIGEVYRRVRLERTPAAYEFRQLVRNETRWFEHRIGPVLEEGRVVAFAVSCCEITARRRGEEALRVLEREITEIANREQRRIGSDLHDGLGQELTGIALLLTGLAGRLQKERHAAAADAGEIAGLVNCAIESTRALARGLSPVSIERGGLPFAMRALAARASDMYGARVRFHSRIWPQLTLEASACTHLYRIAQEAVTNAVRHGHASGVLIDLHVRDERVTLSVTDNGRGFIPGAASSSGMGLRIMQYRAGTLGGSVSFEPQAGGGVRMVCLCRQPAPGEPAQDGCG
jgi:PAS domain S-box-containing protein